MQVKAIGGEKFGEYATVSAYAIYIFYVHICEYCEKNFGLIIVKFANFSPTKIFLCMVAKRLTTGWPCGRVG